MNDGLDADAAAAICRHMNDDHADAIAAYARHFAGLSPVVSATMTGIDRDGMDVAADLGGRIASARIAFDRPLRSAVDARETLIAMARTAAPERNS